MLKILKKVRFLQILLVSLQKCSPLSVSRTNFCPSVKLCNTLNTNRLNSAFYILCGQIKTLHRKINVQENSLQHFMPDIKQQIVKKNSFIKGQFNLPSEIKRLASSIIESLP